MKINPQKSHPKVFILESVGGVGGMVKKRENTAVRPRLNALFCASNG